MNSSDTALQERVLRQISKASSKHPANADEVRKALAGEHNLFMSALESLLRDSQISTAHVQRKGDPAPWRAIWPTGVTLHSSGAWTGHAHAVLFSAQPSFRLPAGPNPEKDPRPDLGRKTKKPKVAALPRRRSLLEQRT